MLNNATQNLIMVEGAATYERIIEAVQDGDIEDGILYINDFLKIYPEFAKAHNDLAVLYYRSGNTLKSLAHYERANKLDPRNSVYMKNLADFYCIELNWIGEAVHLYTDVVKDNPNDTEALNSLGAIHLQLGRREKARLFFTQTLQLDATNQDAKAALQQLPPRPDTVASAPRVIESSSMASTQRSVTACSEQLGQVPGDTASAPPLYCIGEQIYQEAIGLIAKGKQNEAIEALKSLILQDHNHALAHNDLGVLYQRTGDREQARKHHEAAVRLQPTSDIFRKNLADLLASEFDDYEEALRILVTLLGENSSDIELLKSIAAICLKIGNPQDASHFLQQVLTLKPWDQEASEALRAINATLTDDTGNR
jgi:Flp pilus assembly protein TadD